jgi:hypothetical protein
MIRVMPSVFFASTEMLTADLVRKHIRYEQTVPADSKHWFPLYGDDPSRSFRVRVEEQHWITRSVNESWNTLTREALELLADATDAVADTVGGVYVFSDEESLFTGFRNGAAPPGSALLVLNLKSLQDELVRSTGTTKFSWCVIS